MIYMEDKLSDFKNLNKYWEKLESYVIKNPQE